MIIGGLQRNSLIDYPGKIGCICFLPKCNFRCPYCHNPDLVSGRDPYPSRISENDFFQFLETRKGLLDAVVVSGGEPTLQELLPSFCKKIREMGFSVKLDTNGSRPSIIRRLIYDGLLDYVAMDLKTEPEKYPSLMNADCDVENILESVRIIMEARIPYEFRTTCVKPFVDMATLGRMAALIRGAKRYVLQPFHRTRILNPGYFHGQDPGYTPDEMKGFKAAVEPLVQSCLIR